MKLFSAVDQLGYALDFHRTRHAVLSSNIANVDTPGYKPMDIKRSQPMPTAPLPSGKGIDQGKTQITAFTTETESVGPDGNGVQLERELAKLDANRIRYQAASEFMSRRLALLRYAASGGNG